MGLLPVGCVILSPQQNTKSVWGLMVIKKWYKMSRLCHCGIWTLDLSRILAALQYKNGPPNSSYPHFVINIMLHTKDNSTVNAIFTIRVTKLTFLWLWITGLDVLQERPLNNVATRNKFPCRYIEHTFCKIFKRLCECNVGISFCCEHLQPVVFRDLRLNFLCNNKKAIPSSASKNNYLFIFWKPGNSYI